MHPKFRPTVAVGLLCYAAVGFAVPTNYVGLQYKYRHMPGRTTSAYSTEQVLPSHYNGGEIYFAHRFADDVGIHIGYEQSASKQINYVFSNNQPFIGPPMQAGNSASISTRIRAVQFDMVGYVDFYKGFEAIGQFGFALLNADMQAYTYTAGIRHNLAPSKGYKFVPRLSLGIQYFIANSRFGVRLMGDWEGTNLYRMQMTDDDGIRHTLRPFKQSWCVTTGIVLKVN